MKDLEQIGLIAAIAIIAWLYFTKNKTAANISVQSSDGQNAPWFLTYNYPTGFVNNNLSLLPQNAISNEQTPDNVSGCTMCNLFSFAGNNV